MISAVHTPDTADAALAAHPNGVQYCCFSKDAPVVPISSGRVGLRIARASSRSLGGFEGTWDGYVRSVGGHISSRHRRQNTHLVVSLPVTHEALLLCDSLMIEYCSSARVNGQPHHIEFGPPYKLVPQITTREVDASGDRPSLRALNAYWAFVASAADGPSVSRDTRVVSLGDDRNMRYVLIARRQHDLETIAVELRRKLDIVREEREALAALDPAALDLNDKDTIARLERKLW